MTADVVARHMQAVRELSKPGNPLGTNAPTASVNNPAWWIGGERTPTRRRLHDRLIADARAAAPDVEKGRRAIVLAGPPGAGKSTVLNDVLGSNRAKFLVVDADEFKRALLHEAIADGSYEAWLKPAEIRAREAAGERYFPLELASLVHEESSFLAQSLRRDAIDAGENLVIDTVLSSKESALRLGAMLQAADYDVRVIDVEVPYELSAKRIYGRWEQSYTLALEGGDSLGGRWVPSEYARDVFESGTPGQSKPALVARELADRCTAVSRYRVFRTSEEEAARPNPRPQIVVDMTRATPTSDLRDTHTVNDDRSVSDVDRILDAAFPLPATDALHAGETTPQRDDPASRPGVGLGPGTLER